MLGPTVCFGHLLLADQFELESVSSPTADQFESVSSPTADQFEVECVSSPTADQFECVLTYF